MCVGWTKVGLLCREVRVGLFEKMRFEQTFEGSGHEEFSTCRGQPVQVPQGENMPEIFEKKKKELMVSLTHSTHGRIEEEMPEK